jgi:hypothetical protein
MEDDMNEYIKVRAALTVGPVALPPEDYLKKVLDENLRRPIL